MQRPADPSKHPDKDYLPLGSRNARVGQPALPSAALAAMTRQVLHYFFEGH